MPIFLDTAVVIYLVEYLPLLGQSAADAVARIGPSEIISNELVRMEALVMPRRMGQADLETEFNSFIDGETRIVGFSRGVFDRALGLRAKYRSLKSPDAIYLSVAIESQCQKFVTNDKRLLRITEIQVEII